MKSLKIILFIFLCIILRFNLFPCYFGIGTNLQFIKTKMTINDPIKYWNERLRIWLANIETNSETFGDSEASSFFIRNERFNLFKEINFLPAFYFLFGYENFLNKKCFGFEMIFESSLIQLKKNEIINIKNDVGTFISNIKPTGGNVRRVIFEVKEPLISNSNLILKNSFSFSTFLKIGFMLFDKTTLYTKIGVGLKKLEIKDFDLSYSGDISLKELVSGNLSREDNTKIDYENYSFLKNPQKLPEIKKNFYTFSFPFCLGVDQFFNKNFFVRFEYKIQIFNEKRLSDYGIEEKITQQLMSNEVMICLGIKL